MWAAGAALDGVPIEQIRDALGHSTVKITEQHYAQIHPDYREKAREYAKRTYASDVTYKVGQNNTNLMFYIYFLGTLSATTSTFSPF